MAHVSSPARLPPRAHATTHAYTGPKRGFSQRRAIAPKPRDPKADMASDAGRVARPTAARHQTESQRALASERPIIFCAQPQ